MRKRCWSVEEKRKTKGRKEGRKRQGGQPGATTLAKQQNDLDYANEVCLSGALADV